MEMKWQFCLNPLTTARVLLQTRLTACSIHTCAQADLQITTDFQDLYPIVCTKDGLNTLVKVTRQLKNLVLY